MVKGTAMQLPSLPKGGLRAAILALSLSATLAPSSVLADPLQEPKPVPIARLTPADWADVFTTAAALSVMGDAVAEANPIVAMAGPDAVPLVGIGMKYGIKKLLIHSGASQCKVDRNIGTGSMLGACNNTVLLLGGSTTAAPIIGAICAFAYYKYNECPQEQENVAAPKEQETVLILIPDEAKDAPMKSRSHQEIYGGGER
jgi:hypothetical protein